MFYWAADNRHPEVLQMKLEVAAENRIEWVVQGTVDDHNTQWILGNRERIFGGEASSHSIKSRVLNLE